MAEINCSACSELRENSSDFVVNGTSETVCTSLKNDTGFNPSSGHTNCEDLDDANDCLIGLMAQEIDEYEVCDWKDFMKHFIDNIWNFLKAMVCSMCGLWTNIHRHDCEIKSLYNGASFAFGENTQGKSSKLVPGKGVDFSLRSSSDEHASDVTIVYVAGGLCYLTGSLRTFTQNYVDGNGASKSGNSYWNFSSSSYDLPKGGELLYEIRIKRSEYPQIKRFFSGNAFASGAYNEFYQARIIYFDEGQYAYGQHGWCNVETGAASEDGYSNGHKVADGWCYVQVRMAHVTKLHVGNVTDGSGTTKSGSNFTPIGYFGIRINRGSIDC